VNGPGSDRSGVGAAHVWLDGRQVWEELFRFIDRDVEGDDRAFAATPVGWRGERAGRVELKRVQVAWSRREAGDRSLRCRWRLCCGPGTGPRARLHDGGSRRTSVLAMAIGCSSALLPWMGQGVQLDWFVIGIFTLSAVIGSFLGGRLVSRVCPERLSAAFTMLLIAVALHTAARASPSCYDKESGRWSHSWGGPVADLVPDTPAGVLSKRSTGELAGALARSTVSGSIDSAHVRWEGPHVPHALGRAANAQWGDHKGGRPIAREVCCQRTCGSSSPKVSGGDLQD